MLRPGLFAALDTSRHLLLAVSGGPDSTALLLLIESWRQERDTAVSVATVDHRLRDGSAAEAAQVAALCAARGLAHHVLVRDGAPFRSRIQERARAARHELLQGCAERIGADTLVTAHHADDQAETVLMRLTRGSGVAGLAGIAERSRRGDLAVVRPLLHMRKAELVAVCADAGVTPLRDPSNTDRAFRRTGLRALASTLERQGLDAAALTRLSGRAARAEDALAWALARAGVTARVKRQSQCAVFGAEPFAALPEELRLRLLAAELARLAPGAPVRLERLERLVVRLADAVSEGRAFAATLAGCKVAARGEAITVARAPARRDTMLRAPGYPSSAALLGKAARDP